MKKQLSRFTIALPILVIVLTITSYVTIDRSKPKSNTFSLRSKAVETIVTSTPIPPREELFKHPSPDGQVFVQLKATFTSPTTTQYIISTTDKDGANVKEVYKTALTDKKFVIPFNSWSPDNKYFFIQNNSGDAFVFHKTGDTFGESEQFLAIKDEFHKTERTNTYESVTGWASPALLIIHTKNPDSTKGSSYWFEVPSKAIIQLSGDF